MMMENLQDAAKAIEMEFYSDISLPQETNKNSNKWSNFIPKATRGSKNTKQNTTLVEIKKS